MIELDGASKQRIRRASAAPYARPAGRSAASWPRASSTATRPLEQELRASARVTLPRRGGLGEWAAKLRVTEQQSSSGARTTTTVTAQMGNARLGMLDSGRVEHLTYGRGPLRPQRIRGGFARRVFTGAVSRRVEQEGARALARATKQIAREAS